MADKKNIAFEPAPRLRLTDEQVQERILYIGHEISLLTAPPHIVNRLIQERLELQQRLWVSRYLRQIQEKSKHPFIEPSHSDGFGAEGFKW